ncbi:MAG: hypothetical protein MK207_10125 [Saprospiraceae bacterium]|nr:hypothetical protein [Saprospiraceae bacterium]
MKFLQIIFIVSLSITIVKSQNKTIQPSTFSSVCFYTIKKKEFQNYINLKKAIDNKDFSPVFIALKKMKSHLKSFNEKDSDRNFELWYSGNYIDFKNQISISKESTLTSLREYEKRLRQKKAIYYDHRLFLEQYLAYETEAFFADYWFMSQERYFSIEAVERMIKLNPIDGNKLFNNSAFYSSFNIFNNMSYAEENNIKTYLNRKDTNTKSYIPFKYMLLNQSNAGYILNNCLLDNTTMNLKVDREISALKMFLESADKGLIYLVARFNQLK